MSLTSRQERFVKEYAKTGNGSLAARKSGYTQNPDAAAVTASRLLSKANVSEEVQKHRLRLLERLDISREKVINDIAHIAEQAHVNGDYAPAIKANELILKAQGYLIERSMNVSLDVTQSHLAALQQYTDSRIEEAVGQIRDEMREQQEPCAEPIHTRTDLGEDRVTDVMESNARTDDTQYATCANPLRENDNQGEAGQ